MKQLATVLLLVLILTFPALGSSPNTPSVRTKSESFKKDFLEYQGRFHELKALIGNSTQRGRIHRLNHPQMLPHPLSSVPLANYPPKTSESLSETKSGTVSIDPTWVQKHMTGSYPSPDIVNAIAADAAGNVYITGMSGSPTDGGDYLTIKYDSAGIVQWMARYNGPGNDYDWAYAIAVDADGNVYVTGASPGNNIFPDVATVKYNSAGVQQWVARYDGPSHTFDYAVAIAIDPAGNVLVTGVSASEETNDDYLTIKYSPSGTEQWVRRYDGPQHSVDIPTGIAVDAQGSAYVTGSSDGANVSDIVTVKYSADGTEEWVSRFDGSHHGDDHGVGVAIDRTGDIVVAGSTETQGNNWDFLAMKFSPSGAVQWTSLYNRGGYSFEEPCALAIDSTNCPIVTGLASLDNGLSYCTVKFGPDGVQKWASLSLEQRAPGGIATSVTCDRDGNISVAGSCNTSNEGMVIKYDSSGLQQWVYSSVGIGANIPPGVFVTMLPSGALFLGGTTSSSSTGPDFAAASLTPEGTQRWLKGYDGPGSDINFGTTMTTDRAGNIIVSGNNFNYGASTDILTLKYSPSGEELWSATFDGGANSSDIPAGIVTDDQGNIYVGGTSGTSSSRLDFVIIKYSPNGRQLWAVHCDAAGNASDDFAVGIARDSAGNIYIAGNSTAANGKRSFTTACFSDDGVQRWATCYKDGTDAGAVVGVATDRAGFLYVAGFRFVNSRDRFTLLKYAPDGIIVWEATDSSLTGNALASAMTLDPAGNIIITGTLLSGNAESYCTSKYDPNGNRLWTKQYDGIPESINNPQAAATDAAGNVIVSGLGTGSDTTADLITVCYAPSGLPRWISRYNGQGSSEEYFSGLAVNQRGTVFVAGGSILDQSSGKSNLALLCYDSDGGGAWVGTFTESGNISDYSHAVVADTSGNAYVTGESGVGGRSFTVTIRYGDLPHFSKEQKYMAFDTLEVSCTSTGRVTVWNTDVRTIEYQSIVSDDPNFTVEPTSAAIEPGRSASFMITFNPISDGSHTGHIVFSAPHSQFADTVTASGNAVGIDNSILITTTFDPAWQLISNPVATLCPRILPRLFNFGQGYNIQDTLTPGRGYWQKVEASTIVYAGLPFGQISVDMQAKWNIIGSLSYPLPVSKIRTLPDSLIATKFYGYNGGYFEADTIYPGHAYWVKMKTSGQMILDTAATAAIGAAPKTNAMAASSLTFTDADGRKQQLFFASSVNAAAYELPPVPPSGAFDIRYGNDMAMASKASNRILLSGVHYPLQVKWNAQDASAAILVIDGKEIDIRGAGSTTVQTELSSLQLRIESTVKGTLPSSFALHQNYPNPFNPSTAIYYDLPSAAKVRLSVYNVLGQEVARLVDDMQEAGHRSVTWDAASAPSGIYFYTLLATDAANGGMAFTSTLKMALVK